MIVALSFTLARRESTLLGIRVKGGLQSKRASGGYPNYAPDGYINIEGEVTGAAKKISGRHETWIEQDPERAPIIRFAFDLLLQDRLTLDDICESFTQEDIDIAVVAHTLKSRKRSAESEYEYPRRDFPQLDVCRLAYE